MSQHRSIVSRHTSVPANTSQYVVGFLLSVLLTGTAFFLAMNHSVSDTLVLVAIVSLALLQLVVQLQFFIHLEHESGTKWNALIFWFMALVVFIVVAGSLWIMMNLDYHGHTSPQETEEYLLQEEGIKR